MGQRRVGRPEDPAHLGIVIDAGEGPLDLIAPAGATLNGAPLGSGGGGAALVVKDEGVTDVAAATTLDFVGAGVSVADAGGGVATVTVSGAYGSREAGLALAPAGAKAQTIPRWYTSANLAVGASGTLILVGIGLDIGTTITSIAWRLRNTAPITPTNQWFGLFDNALGKLALTADDTTTAWGSFGGKQLNLTAPYVTTYSGLHYVGVCVVAATPPSYDGQAITGGGRDLPPLMCGTSTTGLTNPASCPATVAAITRFDGQPYVYVS